MPFHFTIEDLKKSKVAAINPQLLGNSDTLKKSKYRSKRTEVNGIVFDSKKESEYYKKLLLLLKSGEIGLLQRQVSYELNPGGTHSLKYVADFEYIDKKGVKHTVDVKGFRTREYRKKKKLMKQVHNIIIEEI